MISNFEEYTIGETLIFKSNINDSENNSEPINNWIQIIILLIWGKLLKLQQL